MINENIKRNYNLSDMKLYNFAFDLVINLRIDIEELTKFGVTPEKIEELKDLYTEFIYSESDEQFQFHIVTATKQKKELFMKLKESMKLMILRFQLKFGKKSLEYKSLDSKGLTSLIDDSVLSLARRILEKVNIYYDDLVDSGLTVEIVNEYENLIIEAESAMNNQKNWINKRGLNTYQRIKKGNELYELVVNYSEIGKKYFEMTNPSKYSKYVISK